MSFSGETIDGEDDPGAPSRAFEIPSSAAEVEDLPSGSMEVTVEPAETSWSAVFDLYSVDDFTGAGQTIVVIDTGYSAYYDNSATIFEYDFGGELNDSSADEGSIFSHGSWVAQTVTAEAEEASIIHLKVVPDEGFGASLADIEEALDFVIDHADEFDFSAVNLSLGFGNASEETETSLSDEFAELDALGIFSIVAAGNSGENYDDGVNVLAADPNVIGVSAVDNEGAFAGFSQTSKSLTDITALGVDVKIETVFGSSFSLSGTSFAAPQIAGIAARLQQAAQTTIGEDLTDEEFLYILQQSGTAIADAETTPAGFKIANGDAAVQYFLDNAPSFGPLDDMLIA
ncbi:MAG: S8/S53 family peptidase [Pseudomonadota bacterium]